MSQSTRDLTSFYQTLIPLIDFVPLRPDEEQYREVIKQKANKLIELSTSPVEIEAYLKMLPVLAMTIETLRKTKQAIKTLQDPYNPQMQTIALLKKNLTQYTNQHIERFNEMQKFYNTIDNKPLAWQMGLYKNIFTSFQDNPHQTMKSFGVCSEYVFITIADVAHIRKKGSNPRNKAKAKKLLGNHALAMEISKVGKFFEGYGLQPKAIEMSASIKLFKYFEDINAKHDRAIDKLTLADAIVALFLSYDMSVKVYPYKMKNVFIKSTFQGMHIYAYQSDKKSQIINIESIEKRIGKKLDPEQIKSMSQKRFYKQVYERFAGNLNLASYLS